ncbi:MAG TPA: hypothetical protein VN493_01290 [Thermoanaerobaculia bacterium]|nr:hypothetical protein [Thermoanaerobaculia bacterium]
MGLLHKLSLHKHLTSADLCDAVASEWLVNTTTDYSFTLFNGTALSGVAAKQIRVEVAKDEATKVYLELNEKAGALDLLEQKVPKVNKDFSNLVNLTPQVHRLRLELAQKKQTLLTTLWGTATTTVVSEGVLSGLDTALTGAMTGQGKWSLQVLPESLERAGHHMALKRLEKAINLLDPASALYIYETVEETAVFAKNLLLEGGFKASSRYVLLKIA